VSKQNDIAVLLSMEASCSVSMACLVTCCATKPSEINSSMDKLVHEVGLFGWILSVIQLL